MRPTIISGWVSGLIAVMAFGLTLPVTRFIRAELDPLLVGLGRAAIAGLVAAIILWWFKASIPSAKNRRSLFIVAAGVVLGFPFFSAWAMQFSPASHGGVVLAILPLMTALVSRVVAGEQSSIAFWLVSLLGGFLVLMYLRPDGGWRFHPGDVLLLLAAISAAIGYAVGGKLSRQMPGWQVICWALVLTLPLSLPVFIWRASETAVNTSYASWLGFIYLALVSQLLAFFLWYHGMALSGITRISQIQLFQPFVTLAAAAIWLHESLGPNTLLFAILIVTTVLIGQKTAIYQK